MRSSTLLSIGELAHEFDLAPHVLRHWENEGILEPTDRVGGKRRYDESAKARVRTIVAAKQAGMELATIREVFTTHSGPARQGILADRLQILRDRMQELQRSIDMLEHLRICKNTDFAKCPDYLAIAGASECEPITSAQVRS